MEMSKRARHTGSIHERSKGSWRIRYWLSPDADGKQKQATETVRGTRKEAESALRERITAVENGGYIAKTRQNLAEFMRQWLDIYAATNTSLRTQQGYRQKINAYIIPTIGNIRLQALEPQRIQLMYADLLDYPLSAQTALHTHRILKEALSHAVLWRALTHNPADATMPPRPAKKELEMWDI